LFLNGFAAYGRKERLIPASVYLVARLLLLSVTRIVHFDRKPPLTPTGSSDETRQGPLSLALAVLDAMGQKGMVIVPAHPTPQMLDAGKGAGAADGSQAAAIYTAMLDATD